ncbi:hypothetical protein N7517_010031 [Penicillium concentricum]|uniref:Carboxylic ester hydrolase n=1 Tax=Penicillium concentricum TaxID=293559 RepID=A0A9W9RJR7_9EURO|nr:uncharacterized protein N7517_010031 [Penicillium concentricum]KAJ5360840.1 hypothetical protein N7517_010031 [Penicillium concentricum]
MLYDMAEIVVLRGCSASFVLPYVSPRGCEINAITAETIKDCDGLDGVLNGYISLPGACEFDSHVLVGQSYDCGGSTETFTNAAADVVHATWSGPRSSTGKWQWYGFAKDSPLGGSGMEAASTLYGSDSDSDGDAPYRGVLFPIWTS